MRDKRLGPDEPGFIETADFGERLPGLSAWAPDDGAPPFFGVDRTVEAVRFTRPFPWWRSLWLKVVYPAKRAVWWARRVARHSRGTALSDALSAVAGRGRSGEGDAP